MATKVLIPNPDQVKKIQNALARDKQSNFNALEYYLKQVIVNRDVTFALVGGEELVVPAREAWRLIVDWSQGEGELPVGDRQSYINIRSRATKLLDYLQTNVSGKTAEAAGSYRLILDQANTPAKLPLPGTNPLDQTSNLQKVFDLRRKQIELLESKFLNPLTTNLSKSKLLAGISDAPTRAMVLQMLAAGNANFRYIPKEGYQNFTAEKIHQLLLHQPGIRNTSAVMRLAYSKTAQEDFKELSSIINKTIEDTYPDEEKYQQDMTSLRSLSGLSPTLDSISYLVKGAGVSADPAETEALIKSIRSQIIFAARGEHVDGRYLIKNALKAAGFPEITVDYFTKLVPYVEEIQIKQRHLLLGSDLSDHDSRLLATSDLAAEIGVDLTTPWIKEKELNQITERAISSTAEEYYTANPSKNKGNEPFNLQKAFDFEYAKGPAANPHKLAEFTNLMSKHRDFGLYHKSVDGNFGYQFQEFLSKGIGNYRAIKQPVDRFTEKVWGGIESIDDIIRGPQRKLANWWDETQEKYPWLNPAALISGKLVEYQTGIALKIHAWAIKVSTSNAWFRSFAGHVADFTEGFIKHDAHWSGAGSFFISRKIGNTLDWATKFASKGKHGTFTSLRFAMANKVWDGFSKLAPNLSTKMATDGFKKIIIGIIGGEMTMGVSIAIQVGWEVIKYGFGFIKKFLTDQKFRDKFFRTAPLLIGGAISASLLFVSGLPAAIVAGASIVGAAIMAGLQLIIMSLAPLFALAALVAFSIVTFFTILWYGLIAPTFNIDSGPGQIVANIVCTLAGQEAPGSSTNPRLAAGKCVFELLSKVGINPLNRENSGGVNFATFAQGLGNGAAAEEARYSAQTYGAFQCVGFDVVVNVMTGGSNGFTHAKYLNTIEPSGCNFVDGVGSCAPGDYFVDTGGDWGHTGLFVSLEGANIVCLDANSDGHGLVRDETTCRWPTSRIAGCLKCN